MRPAEKPSLADIAAMPFPASRDAMRAHYDPLWGKFMAEGDLRSWKVTINYSVRSSESVSYNVEATSTEEAEALADELFDKDNSIPGGIDVEVDDVEVKEIVS